MKRGPRRARVYHEEVSMVGDSKSSRGFTKNEPRLAVGFRKKCFKEFRGYPEKGFKAGQRVLRKRI